MLKRRLAASLIGMALFHVSPTPLAAREPQPPTQAARGISLETARAEALKANEDVSVAQLQVIRSVALRREALAALMPNMSGSLSGSMNGPEVKLGDRTISRKWDWGGNLRGGVVVFDPSLYPLYSAADELVEASELANAWTERTVAFQVEQAFFSLAAAQEEVAVAERTLALRNTYLERAEALAEQGVALPLDAARARSQSLAAQQALIESKARLGNLADSLAVLLGRPADGALRVVIGANPPAPPSDAANVEGRPDLLASGRQVDAIALRENAVWWSLFPALGLSGNARFGPENLSNPDGVAWSLSLDLTWTIYDGGARYARMEVLAAEADQTRMQLQRAKREASAESVRSLRTWRASHESIAVAEEARKVAQEAYDMALARFEAGLATSVEVSEASDELVRAEIAVVTAALQTQLAASQYRYTLGEE